MLASGDYGIAIKTDRDQVLLLLLLLLPRSPSPQQTLTETLVVLVSHLRVLPVIVVNSLAEILARARTLKQEETVLLPMEETHSLLALKHVSHRAVQIKQLYLNWKNQRLVQLLTNVVFIL